PLRTPLSLTSQLTWTWPSTWLSSASWGQLKSGMLFRLRWGFSAPAGKGSPSLAPPELEPEAPSELAEVVAQPGAHRSQHREAPRSRRGAKVRRMGPRGGVWDANARPYRLSLGRTLGAKQNRRGIRPQNERCVSNAAKGSPSPVGRGW